MVSVSFYSVSYIYFKSQTKPYSKVFCACFSKDKLSRNMAVCFYSLFKKAVAMILGTLKTILAYYNYKFFLY